MVVKSCKALYVGSIPARASTPSKLTDRVPGRTVRSPNRRPSLPPGGHHRCLRLAATEPLRGRAKQLQALRGPDIPAPCETGPPPPPACP